MIHKYIHQYALSLSLYIYIYIYIYQGRRCLRPVAGGLSSGDLRAPVRRDLRHPQADEGDNEKYVNDQ